MDQFPHSPTDDLWDRVIQGEGSIECRKEALVEVVQKILLGLMQTHEEIGREFHPVEWKKAGRICGKISEASILLATLGDLLKARCSSGLKLELQVGVNHRPPDWAKRKARAAVDNRAARIVERLVRSGMQQESAILTVAARKRCRSTRNRIFEALRIRREIRENLPFASEAVLLSWLVGGGYGG
jgi:hypothetical protein